METKFDALIPLVDRQYGRFGRETPLDGLLLNRAETPSGLMRSVYRPSFCLVVQGAKDSMLGDQSFRYRAGQGLFASIDVPVTARIPKRRRTGPTWLSASLSIQRWSPNFSSNSAKRSLEPPPSRR